MYIHYLNLPNTKSRNKLSKIILYLHFVLYILVNFCIVGGSQDGYDAPAVHRQQVNHINFLEKFVAPFCLLMYLSAHATLRSALPKELTYALF